MRLRDGGIDIFYIDESHDNHCYVVTAIAIPFLRKMNGIWTITWQNHFDAAKAWRNQLRQQFNVPASKELHGVDLASGRGNYNYGKYNFSRAKAANIYRNVLALISFVPSGSVVSACAHRGNHLYGHDRLEASLYALFQRMRRQCDAKNVNAFVFFDQGHPEYRTLYRKAQVYLPTGSRLGIWASGAPTQNLPLDMFTKDANEKNSKHCHFTQAVDLIAYAAFMKMKHEKNRLTAWQQNYALGNLYDSLHASLKNTRASNRAPQDGIVRL